MASSLAYSLQGEIFHREERTLDPLRVFSALSELVDDLVWVPIGDGEVVLGTGRKRLKSGRAHAFDATETFADAAVGPIVGWLSYEAGTTALLHTSPESNRRPEALSEGGRFADHAPAAAWIELDRWIRFKALALDSHSASDSRSTVASSSPVSVEIGAQHAAFPAWAELVDASMLEGGMHSSDAARCNANAAASFSVREGDEEYRAAIASCTAHIRDGDSYLMCLTSAFEGPALDYAATFLRLRASAGLSEASFLRIDGVVIVSASPELFLRTRGNELMTQPIKGTRPRGLGAEDRRLAEELLASEKERAENLMIVDLCRNDLQHVSEPGSVSVPSLFAIESYAAVHQLVSTVTGVMRAETRLTEVLHSMFPAGSMTGAPKQRTVELLGEIEGVPRGLYSGCFGVIAGRDVELRMTIRSVTGDANASSIGVGGGITALSNVEEELAEMHHKAAAILAATVPLATAVRLETV
ncbi:anthranilate synthase component I family protein [Humidisolicoccus flavus]|uniref:anthranilate synthase component I family protein n=1 Tax=Humidisolicoccus flavus TaxID=3111414 RepID=UPI00324785DE